MLIYIHSFTHPHSAFTHIFLVCRHHCFKHNAHLFHVMQTVFRYFILTPTTDMFKQVQRQQKPSSETDFFFSLRSHQHGSFAQIFSDVIVGTLPFLVYLLSSSGAHCSYFVHNTWLVEILNIQHKMRRTTSLLFISSI